MAVPDPYPPLPSAAEMALAQECSRSLSSLLLAPGEVQRIELRDEHGVAHTVCIPTTALRLLLDMLTEIGAGNAVSVDRVHAELTTQEAADALGVSRPYLVRLLEQGRVSRSTRSARTGACVARNLMAYKADLDARGCKALDDLNARPQALGPYG